MRVISFNITEKFSLDFTYFHKIRNFGDGITFFNCEIKLDRYEADHKPSFDIILEIFNFKIIELNIYNRFHIEE